MTITEEDVVRIARLARLELGPGEKTLFQGQLGRILEYVEQLEASESGPAPDAPAAEGFLREDVPAATRSAEALLANAPAAEGAYSKVPKVLALALAAVLALAGPAAAAGRKGAARGKSDPEGLALMRRGIQAYMEGRFDEGVDVLTQSLARNPTWKTASGFRAICLWTTGDVEGARRDAKVAMAMKPLDAEAHAARGFAHFVSRQLSAAAADFVASARLNRKYAPAYFGMGSVLSSQERLQEALTNLDLALQLDSKAVTANIVRGTVHEKLREFRKAVDDYNRVLKLAPDFHWARHYRGRSYREIKEYKKAIEDFTAFLKSNPDNEQALYLRSNAYFLTGKYAEAIADLSRVVAINPKNGLAYANRGLAYAETGEKDSALADLRRAFIAEDDIALMEFVAGAARRHRRLVTLATARHATGKLTGVAPALLAFAALLLRVVRAGFLSRGNFGRLFCLGAAFMLLAQFFINAGSTLGLFPVVGLPLPFMSYGGSHLLTEWLALDMLSSMERHSQGPRL